MAPVAAFRHRDARWHLAGDDDRAPAGGAPDRCQAEALDRRDEAGDVAGAQPAWHLRRRCMHDEAHALGDAQIAGERLELGLLRAVADQRERAATPRRACTSERLEQARQVLALDVVGDRDDARPVALPAERARGDRRVAIAERVHVDARTHDVHAIAERPGDGLEPRGEILRDGEDCARPGHRLDRRLADAGRALGIRDIGAVCRQRVGRARGLCGAARDRPHGRHG